MFCVHSYGGAALEYLSGILSADYNWNIEGHSHCCGMGILAAVFGNYAGGGF